MSKGLTAARAALRLGNPVYCTNPGGETFRVFRIKRVDGVVFAWDLASNRRRNIEPGARLHDGSRDYGLC